MSTINIHQQQQEQQQRQMEEDQETTESPSSTTTTATTTTTIRNDSTTTNGNNKRTHNQIEVEDTELSLDEDDESDEDDEQLDYFQRKKTFMMAGAASTAIAGQARPPPTSFNYTVLTPEKLQDHPIILRGCDVNTMWDMKELHQLRDNLRQLYDKSRKRIKIFKRDLKKIEMEMQSKQYLPKNKKRKTDNDNNSSNNPGKTSNAADDADEDNDDYLLHIQRMRVCGVVNSKGKRCQRTGFCPFHHRFMGTRRRSRLYSFFTPSKEISANDPAFDVNRSMLAANKKEKNTSMKVSILLVAAAALERNVINEESDSAKSSEQQIGQKEQTTSSHFLPSHYLQQYDQQQQQTATSSNYYDQHKFTPLWNDSMPGVKNFTQSTPAFLASLPTGVTEESNNLPRPVFQEYNNYNVAPLTSTTPSVIPVGNAPSVLPFPNTLHPIDTTSSSGDGRSVLGLPPLGAFVQQPAPTHTFPSSSPPLGSIPPLKELGATPFYQTFPLSSTVIPPAQQQPHQEKYRD
jgi:hypothetical protein